METNAQQKAAFDKNRATLANVQHKISLILVKNASDIAAGRGAAWPLIGTETEVVKLFATALAMLGDRSVVDELGIPY